jgi:hypothetical protein
VTSNELRLQDSRALAACALCSEQRMRWHAHLARDFTGGTPVPRLTVRCFVLARDFTGGTPVPRLTVR